jgi:enoyl-CoA hydratase
LPNDYEFIKCEEKKNYARITFNRPEVMNALNLEMRKEIINALENYEVKKGISSVVITGAGETAFSAGADLKMFQNMTPIEARKYLNVAKHVPAKIESLQKPVIAAVNGYAIGAGLEIVLACDVAIASENAKFGQGEINVGLIPGGGGTQRLPRAVGIKKAKYMVYTGELLDSQTALYYGLVNMVVPPRDLMKHTEEVAEKISTKSQIILRFAKEALNSSQNLGLKEGLDVESQLFSLCFATKDQKEGVSAFLEKRRPNFVGE